MLTGEPREGRPFSDRTLGLISTGVCSCPEGGVRKFVKVELMERDGSSASRRSCQLASISLGALDAWVRYVVASAHILFKVLLGESNSARHRDERRRRKSGLVGNLRRWDRFS